MNKKISILLFISCIPSLVSAGYLIKNGKVYCTVKRCYKAALNRPFKNPYESRYVQQNLPTQHGMVEQGYSGNPDPSNRNMGNE